MSAAAAGDAVPASPEDARRIARALIGEDPTPEEAARWTRAAVASGGNQVVLTGPAPCPIDRIRGRWRWHFLLRARRASTLASICRQLFLRYDPKPGRAELRFIIDRDPVSLL